MANLKFVTLRVLSVVVGEDIELEVGGLYVVQQVVFHTTGDRTITLERIPSRYTYEYKAESEEIKPIYGGER